MPRINEVATSPPHVADLWRSAASAIGSHKPGDDRVMARHSQLPPRQHGPTPRAGVPNASTATQPKPYTPSRRPQPSPSSAPAKPKDPMRFRNVPLILGMTTSLVLAYYLSTVYMGYKADSERAATLDVPADPSARYNQTFQSYDADVDSLEWIMGIKRLRAKLCARATGHVLESAVGTGRNAQYYPLDEHRINSVTMVDKSRFMLDKARLKWPKDGNAWFIKASFRHLDMVNEPVPRPMDSGTRTNVTDSDEFKTDFGGFDTAVQTMGICSTGEPEKLLRILGKAVADSQAKEGGQILLLEHGRSYYDWLNKMLDGIAPAHAERHGCWFNRDVGKIVEESGLEILEEKRYHFGTTWWFVCKPGKGIMAEKIAVEDSKGAATESQTGHKTWWRPW
ncbi:MAG: hypothetical protein M1828_003305 [Chrysothrix sp. TS-e1954]|nr:MAG: hypothetical protein M1828_003305 [Chrysothrix sp. TS-e1954]